MATIPQVTKCVQKVLNEEARQAGYVTGFVQRESKLTAPLFVQTLVFGWLANPQASLTELTQVAAALGLAISAQGLDQRLNESAAQCLQRVLAAAVKQVITAQPVAITLLQRFRGVKLYDTTTITLPPALIEVWKGYGNQTGGSAALKLDVGLDICTGQLHGPFLLDGRRHDTAGPVNKAALPKAALRIGDLAYFEPKLFAEINAQGAYWLTRLKANSIIYDLAGNEINLAKLLKKKCRPQLDSQVELSRTDRQYCRLLAVRVPAGVAKHRRAEILAEAKREAKQPSKRRLALVNWSIYLTNATANLLNIDEVIVLARSRWQIELLFKLWKSHGFIDESRSEKPWRILCEVYAKMLAQVIQHWFLLVSCWQYPNRSLFQAVKTIQKQSFHIATVFHSFNLLSRAIAVIKSCLALGARINKRSKAPSNFQLLLNGA